MLTDEPHASLKEPLEEIARMLSGLIRCREESRGLITREIDFGDLHIVCPCVTAACFPPWWCIGGTKSLPVIKAT